MTVTPAQLAALYAAEALVALGCLRESWPWLADTLTPSHTQPPPGRYLSEQDRHIIGAQIRRDRKAMTAAARDGRWVAGAHADAARVAAVSARQVIAASLKRLCERIHAHLHDGEVLVWPFGDPRQRVVWVRCMPCLGTGRVDDGDDGDAAAGPESTPERIGHLRRLHGWASTPEPGRCGRCGGQGSVLAGNPCTVCGVTHSCSCDSDDAFASWSLSILRGDLGHVADPELAADALRVLERADRHARRAAQAGDDNQRRLRAACPACDRRELVAQVGSPKHDEWAVRCMAPLCVCDGPGCGCGRPVRVRGRRHLWPAREWDSESGLSALLGVRVPDLLPDPPPDPEPGEPGREAA